MEGSHAGLDVIPQGGSVTVEEPIIWMVLIILYAM